MRNKLAACILISIFVLIGFTTSKVYSQTYKKLPKQTTYDAKKTWSISYKMEVDPRTITTKNIFIKDQNNKLVPISLSIKNKKTVVISPKSEYKSNSNYFLYVNANIKSLKKVKGKYIILSQSTITPFYVKSTFSNIQFVPKQLFTNVEVKTDLSIYKVTIKGLEMRYEGKNVYTLALVNLNIGDKITFKAYDKNDVLIETKEVVIK